MPALRHRAMVVLRLSIAVSSRQPPERRQWRRQAVRVTSNDWPSAGSCSQSSRVRRSHSWRWRSSEMGDDSKRSQAERQDSGVGMSIIVTTDYFHH